MAGLGRSDDHGAIADTQTKTTTKKKKCALTP